jgi:hypothetical protein
LEVKLKTQVIEYRLIGAFDVILKCLLNGFFDYEHNVDDSNADSDSDQR